MEEEEEVQGQTTGVTPPSHHGRRLRSSFLRAHTDFKKRMFNLWPRRVIAGSSSA